MMDKAQVQARIEEIQLELKLQERQKQDVKTLAKLMEIDFDSYEAIVKGI